jgi:hypothetical protein
MKKVHDAVAGDPGPVVEAGPAAEAKRLVGTVKELWRYPVKSMLGGTVSELLVTEQGGLGDRAWALRDQRNGRIVSAKRVPRLLEFRATYEVEPTPESAGVVRIETPDGDTVYAGQEDASARISSILGRPVVLDNFARPDERASIDRNTVFGDVPVSQMKPDWTPETMPDYFQLKRAVSLRSVPSSCLPAARSSTCAACREAQRRSTAGVSGPTCTLTPGR